MTDAELSKALEVEAERDQLRILNAELLASLKNITARFERCMLAHGNSAEIAALNVAAAHAVIAKAEPHA